MMPADSVTAHPDLGLAPVPVPGSQRGSALQARVPLNLLSTLASGSAPEKLRLSFFPLGARTITNWQQ